MTERPILFSGAMVRAILSGQKTQTRRAVKGVAIDWLNAGLHPDFVAMGENRLCPYGQPGDRLWLRETHAPQPDCWGAWSNWLTGNYKGPKPITHYRADGGQPWVDKWRPSIHMPRFACRIALEITGVRIERLQDISESDSVAEGTFSYAQELYRDPRVTTADIEALMAKYGEGKACCLYAALWESINGTDSWSANPWVWAIEFKRVSA